eukprot:1136266-Pelagomonas_calceolata.AAC.2
MEGKLEVKEGRWVPLSVVKGGPAANYLLKAMESEWGRKLYSKTLLRQIGMAIYRSLQLNAVRPLSSRTRTRRALSVAGVVVSAHFPLDVMRILRSAAAWTLAGYDLGPGNGEVKEGGCKAEPSKKGS